MIKYAKGYTKLEAYNSTEFTVPFSKLKNATMAWKKAGSPLDKIELNNFFKEYTENHKLLGAYIVLQTSSPDLRKSPYTIITEKNSGRRTFKKVYLIVEAEFDIDTKRENLIEVKNLGAVCGEAYQQKDALIILKNLVADTKKDYVIVVAKKVSSGNRFAGFGLYTPSKNAKEGAFLFYVQE